MVPIYDTDIAEERWSRSKWEHYELWEKLEVRLRFRKRMWILGTVLVFFTLFSIPILSDQRPKRASLNATRLLANEISTLKVLAGTTHSAYRIRFIPGATPLQYRIERVFSCTEGATSSSATAEIKQLTAPETQPKDELILLSARQGAEFGFAGLTEEFCYDPLKGSSLSSDPIGFAIIPAKDLAERRFDRMSVLQLKGSSAEISFE